MNDWDDDDALIAALELIVLIFAVGWLSGSLFTILLVKP